MTGTWSELLEYVARKPVTRRKGVDDGCRLWVGTLRRGEAVIDWRAERGAKSRGFNVSRLVFAREFALSLEELEGVKRVRRVCGDRRCIAVGHLTDGRV